MWCWILAPSNGGGTLKTCLGPSFAGAAGLRGGTRGGGLGFSSLPKGIFGGSSGGVDILAGGTNGGGTGRL